MLNKSIRRDLKKICCIWMTAFFFMIIKRGWAKTKSSNLTLYYHSMMAFPNSCFTPPNTPLKKYSMVIGKPKDRIIFMPTEAIVWKIDTNILFWWITLYLDTKSLKIGYYWIYIKTHLLTRIPTVPSDRSCFTWSSKIQ